MRPPQPATYALEDGATAGEWAFTTPPLDYGDGAWSCGNNYANGCPISFPNGKAADRSRLTHSVCLRPCGTRKIALLRVFATDGAATRPALARVRRRRAARAARESGSSSRAFPRTYAMQ